MAHGPVQPTIRAGVVAAEGLRVTIDAVIVERF
jgi:hypothetical protein